MIYLKDNLEETYFIDDDLTIKGTSEVGTRIIYAYIEQLKPFKPENGSPTLLLKNLLEDKGFKIIDFELPIIEQVESIVY